MERIASSLPDGIELSPLAQRVFDVLAEFTAFPWPVLLAQTRRIRVDPAQLGRDDLRQLVPHLAKGVARFTSPQKGVMVRERLEALLDPSV